MLKLKNKFIILFTCIISILVFVGCKEEAKQVNTDSTTIFPVSGQIMNSSQVSQISSSCRARLYFITQKGDLLSSEMKLISFGEKEKRTEYLASSIVNMLISGPSNTRLSATIPEGTKLNSVKIKNSIATVDLGGDFLAGLEANASKAELILYSITNTLTEFKDISSVTILYNGNEITVNSQIKATNMERNIEIITDIDSAAKETEYTENVFLEIELE